jgi:DNA-binding CsgD family transcriptional regulator
VRASNALLDDVADTLIPVSFGGMAISHAPANKLFQEAIAATGSGHDGVVRSIPVPAQGERPAVVIHVIPLRRSAYDIFSGADIMVAATSVSASRMVPSPSVLMGLFDITPAEVKLVSALAQGQSLKKAAQDLGIQFSTARSYLDRIFRKTGTHQQSELVALIKSAQPL